MKDKNTPIKSLKVILIFLVLCFSFSAMLGYLYGGGVAEVIEKVLRRIFGGEEGLSRPNPLFLAFIILANNAVKTFLIIPLGVLLAIPPILFISFNGFLLGIFTYLSVRKLGEAGFLYILTAIAPHGIFEFPAVFLSSALSIRVSLVVLLKLKGEDISVSDEIKRGLKIYLHKVLPLLIIAAVTEVSITPIIISTFFPT